jgi:hypothetical protein
MRQLIHGSGFIELGTHEQKKNCPEEKERNNTASEIHIYQVYLFLRIHDISRLFCYPFCGSLRYIKKEIFMTMLDDTLRELDAYVSLQRIRISYRIPSGIGEIVIICEDNHQWHFYDDADIISWSGFLKDVNKALKKMRDGEGKPLFSSFSREDRWTLYASREVLIVQEWFRMSLGKSCSGSARELP